MMQMGLLLDYQNPYKTMDSDYKGRELEILKMLREKGLIYKDRKPVFWSPSSKTALAEAELEYNQNHISHSLYVKFKCAENCYLLIWTTTPWTLIANQAIAYNKNISYSKVSYRGQDFAIATTLIPSVFATYDHVESVDLAKISTYQGLDGSKKPLVAANFVTEDSGTGLVHIAPAYGKDDYEVFGNSEIIDYVTDDGTYNENAPESLQGVSIFDDDTISDYWRDFIFKREKFTHKFPIDWRTKGPVIQRITSQWFMDINKVKDSIDLSEVSFYPSNGHEKLEKMIQSRRDWCISRQRSWGLAIPESERDTLDVWFDSGTAWSLYGDTKSDLLLEGNDQYRGWFQSSTILSYAVNNQPPSKQIVSHGFVVDESGNKMSKSLGNVINPLDIISGSQGIDLLRLWVASVDFTNDVSIGPNILKNISDTLSKIRNTLRFILGNIQNYEQHNYEPDLYNIDRWMIAETSKFVQESLSNYSLFKFQNIHQDLSFFTNEIVSTYISIVKDRVYSNSETSKERVAAQFTLEYLLCGYLRVIAPILPILSEEIHVVKVKNFECKSVFEFLKSFKPTSMAIDPEFTKLLSLKKYLNKKIENQNISILLKLFVSPTFTKFPKHELIEIFNVYSVEFDSSLSDDDFRFSVENVEKCVRCWMTCYPISEDQSLLDESVDKKICTRCINVIISN